MKRTITGLISALVITGGALAGDTKQFPTSLGWLTWLHIDYPARFEIDPKSFQGEARWWAKFNDPDSGLSFEVGAFGYVNDLDLVMTVPGMTHENHFEKLRGDKRSTEEIIAHDARQKNIGDYFRAEVLPKGCEESKFPGYERFVHKAEDRVVVFFLRNSAYQETFGRCYQTLTFTFPKGGFAKHKKDIEAIIASAKPPYRKRSERDGADQPATAPESKPEGDSKPKPESEGRSQ